MSVDARRGVTVKIEPPRWWRDASPCGARRLRALCVHAGVTLNSALAALWAGLLLAKAEQRTLVLGVPHSLRHVPPLLAPQLWRYLPPVVHGWHDLQAPRPSPGWYLPSGQFLHTVKRSPSANVPATQFVHASVYAAPVPAWIFARSELLARRRPLGLSVAASSARFIVTLARSARRSTLLWAAEGVCSKRSPPFRA